jgi:hypothetical protein
MFVPGRLPTVSLPIEKGRAMKRRMIGWILDVVREPHAEPEAHFHQGPQSTPAVCYDARCRNPRLDIEAG